MQGPTLHEENVGDVVSAGLDGASREVLVINPTRDIISTLVEDLADRESPPTVRLLVDESPLKDLVDDFLIGSAVADLIADDTLTVRTLPEVPRNFLFVSPESVTAVVDGGETMAALTSTEESLVSDTYAHYDGRWEDANEFTLRTPALSVVTETLAEEIGDETARDFVAVLESLEVARGDGEGLDEVTISLLVAARNGVLLYDISKWGEDIGLASKATFSRTKTRLEDNGLIDTEKVPIDVGRPRLRLKLGDDRLTDVPVRDMTAVAADLLAE